MVRNKLISLIGSLTILLCATASQAAIIEFSPSAQVVSVGSLFDVEVRISGLGDFSAPSLGAFDLDVIFDPSVIGFSSISFGDPILGDQLDLFGFGSITSIDDSVSGIVNIFELSLDPILDLDTLQPESFTLATLTFDALSVGRSSLDITFITLSDSLGILLPDVSIIPGSIAVPEPGSLMLLFIGMIGMAYRRVSLDSRSASWPSDHGNWQV